MIDSNTNGRPRYDPESIRRRMCHTEPPHEPSEDEIAALCAEIRGRLTPEQLAKRASGGGVVIASVPVIGRTSWRRSENLVSLGNV